MPDATATVRPRFFFFVNGILTVPEDQNDWNARAVTWIESQRFQFADRFEYFSDAVFRRLFQASRVAACEKILANYIGFDIVLVGHSNGADIICRLLAENLLKVSQVHLISAAAEADFDKNGLNVALYSEKVGKVFLYGSHNDHALQAAQATQWLAPLGLGYGSLGRTGPLNVAEGVAARVVQTWRDDFDHGSWFLPANFAATMTAILEASQ